MAPVVPIVMAIGAKVAAGAAAVKGAIAASAIGSKVIAGVSAVKGAVGAASTAVKGLSVVGKVGSAIGKIGTAVKATKVGGAIAKGVAAVGKTKVGGALIKGGKAVSGFAKAHPVVTSVGQTAAQQGVSSAMSAQARSTYPNFGGALTIGEDTTTASKLNTAAQNSRLDAYNNSVFGSSMSLSNTFAGESGGSGIFSSLLKNKNTLS